MTKRSLPVGVYFDPKAGKYIAKIRIHGIMSRATMHDTPENAAREVARRKHLVKTLPKPDAPKGLVLRTSSAGSGTRR